MQLIHHIAHKFLNDKEFMTDLLNLALPSQIPRIKDGTATISDMVAYNSLCDVLYLDDDKNINYYITKSVEENLSLLKVNGKDGKFNWNVFDHVKDCKMTFIFKDDRCMRVVFTETHIFFFVIYAQRVNKGKQVEINNLFVNRNENRACSHFKEMNIETSKEEYLYKLLCFFYLSENTTIVVNGGKSYGTRKQADALSNDLNTQVTIVNSNWNITSIRSEAFAVKGHFAIRRIGEKRSGTHIVFIKPYKKNGYTVNHRNPNK